MNIRAVIWDMGGVLVRTEDPSPRQRLAEKLKVTSYELEEIVFAGNSGKLAQLGKISLDQHWENICQLLDLESDGINTFKETFFAGDVVDFPLISEIRELRAASIKTGLLSNAFSNLREVLVEDWKIADAFDELIISAEVKLAKPDKRIYQLALERLKTPANQAVFIDDLQENLDAARCTGIHTIRFHNRSQVLEDLHGYLGGRTE